MSIYLHIKRFSISNELLQLWRLRSPSLCHLQAGDPGRPVVQFEGLRASKLIPVDIQSGSADLGTKNAESRRSRLQLSGQRGGKSNRPLPFLFCTGLQ